MIQRHATAGSPVRCALCFAAWSAIAAAASAQDPQGVPGSANDRPAGNRHYLQGPHSMGLAWPNHVKEAEVESDASVVLQVDGDGDYGTQSGLGAMAILTTSAIVEKAASSALKLDAAKTRAGLEVVAMSAGPRMTRLEVRLLKAPGMDWKEGDAEKLIAALADGLRAALEESTNALADAQAQSAKQWEKESAEVAAKLANVRLQQREVRKQLQDIPANFREPTNGARNAANQLAQMEIDLKRLNEQLESADPGMKALLGEWEQVVTLREEKLAQLTTDKRPAGEIKDAEIQLTEARAKLESIKNGVDRSGRSDGGNFARTRSRLQSQQKSYDEMKALVTKLESDEIQQLFDKDQRLTAAELQLHQEASQAANRSEQVRRQYQRPARYLVTVLDGVRD